ncbi:MAG: hypothetical protein DRP15_02180 [Candidatus Aenigmatarchaeota archaeon]|nr:MAG: hypothetical protein DRP15_02180 [Candidatus Aenigmarchaeota archaeon]
MTNKLEPLNGKVIYIPDPFIRFEDVKSACEFYLRYKDKPELLIKEQSKYEEEATGFIEALSSCGEWFSDDIYEIKNDYNKWLFKLAFKDVIKDA